MAILSSPQFPRRLHRASLAALAGAMVAVDAVVAEAGELPAQAAPCFEVAPVDELAVGDPLTGRTVDQGTTPKRFEATVVGVINDGIAVGLDLIIVEATSDAIDEAGGIWAGMSGSPVYTAGGELVGAVAYGFAGNTPIAGITPAAEMVKLLDGGGAAAAAPPRVELTATIERAIVASGAATAEQAASGLIRLPLPVSVSGVGPTRIRRVARLIKRRIPDVRVYAAGRASVGSTALELVPGGNVGAALSYGDITAAAIGTVTAVCDREALLFGHPFLWNGATKLSAHQAAAVLVHPDPLFGPFKVANVGGLVGTVDQDRLAGLHTKLGPGPTSTRVRSELTSVETGASRTSVTHAVLPDFVPDLAYAHVVSNLDRVHDRFGGGVTTLEWGASGERRDGTIWRFRRHEKIADSWDAAFPPAYKMLIDLFTLFNNPFEKITIGRVFATGSIDPVFTEARLVGLEKLGPNGRWQAVRRSTPLRLVAGSEVFLRGVLRSFRSTRLRRVQLSLTVPRQAGREGTLVVSAGADFFFFDEEPGAGASSFPELLANIDRAPTGDTLRAELRLGGAPRITRHARATAPVAIRGVREFEVRIVAAGA